MRWPPSWRATASRPISTTVLPRASCCATASRPKSSPRCAPCRRAFARGARRWRSRGRWEKILGLISPEPRTAHEIAHELWGNVAVTQAYLTLSEVLGHMDLLLQDGRALEIEDGDVARFAAA